MRKHIEPAHLKLLDPETSVEQKWGGHNKKIWLVHSTGVRLLSMVGNHKIRKYYVTLEDLCFRFYDL